MVRFCYNKRRERLAVFWIVMYSYHTTKWKVFPINLSMYIHGLWTGNSIQSLILASVHWKILWHIRTLKSLGEVGPAHIGTQRTPHASKSGHKHIWRLKVSFPWIALLPVMRWDVTNMIRSQNSSPWSGEMRIPYWRKTSRSIFLGVNWFPILSSFRIFSEKKEKIL